MGIRGIVPNIPHISQWMEAPAALHPRRKPALPIGLARRQLISRTGLDTLIKKKMLISVVHPVLH